jgi:hypothetical protein
MMEFVNAAYKVKANFSKQNKKTRKRSTKGPKKKLLKFG